MAGDLQETGSLGAVTIAHLQGFLYQAFLHVFQRNAISWDVSDVLIRRMFDISELYIIGVNEVALAKDNAALNNVLQFSVITLPGLHLQFFPGFLSERIFRRIILTIKMPDKSWNVLLSIFEGGEMQGDNT